MEHVEKVNYRGLTIEISQDTMAENPFEAWDGNVPILTKGYNGNEIEYSDFEGIREYLSNYPTDGQIILHQKKILEIFEMHLLIEEWEEEGLSREDKIFEIRDIIKELHHDFDEMEEFCRLFKIPCKSYTSRGYSQSEWCDVFVLPTEDFYMSTGANPKKAEEIIKGAAELFDSWAWGDVYYYSVDEANNSCGGFYGRDHNDSGLLFHAKDDIDCYLKAKLRAEIQKVKEMIKAKVPLIHRPMEI